MHSAVAAELALAVFEYTSDGILLIDKDRNVRAMNRAAERMLGQPAADVLGQLNCTELDCRDGEGRPLLTTGCRCIRAFSGPPLPYFEMEIIGAGERRLPVAVSAAALPENAFAGGEELVAIVLRDRRTKLQLEEEIQARQRDTELLYSVSRQLSSLTRLDEGMQAVLEEVRQFAGVDLAGLAELADQGEHLSYRFTVSSQGPLPPQQVPIAESPLGETIRTGTLQVIPDLQAEGATCSLPFPGGEEVRGLVLLPLRSRDQILGAVFLASRQPWMLAIHELAPLAAVAGQISTALDNHRLLARLRGEAVKEERRRLAAEIHDSLAQTLALLGQQVARVPEVAAASPAELPELAQRMARLVEQGQQEVRQAIFDLKTEMGLGVDFLSGLQEYLEEFSLLHRISVELKTSPDIKFALSLQVEVQLFRIIQEALNNVVRHSGASQVEVCVERRGASQMGIVVRDNGVGFDPEALPGRGHYGLQIMAERAKAIGGRLTVDSRPGGGTAVEVEIPLEKE